MNKKYFILLVLLMTLPGCVNRWSCTPRFMNRVRPCGHVGTSAYCATEPQADSNIVYQETDITYPNEVTPESTAALELEDMTTSSDLLPETIQTAQEESSFTNEFQDEFVEEPELTQADVIEQQDAIIDEEAENDIFENIEKANELDEEMKSGQETQEDFSTNFEEDTANVKNDEVEQNQDVDSDELDPVLFDFDKKKITDKQEQALSKNLEKIKKLSDKGYKIVIAGHACHSAGKDWYNDKISKERAESVASYLKNQGVNSDNIVIEAHGAKKPVIQEGNSRKQAPNRRVEIHV